MVPIRVAIQSHWRGGCKTGDQGPCGGDWRDQTDGLAGEARDGEGGASHTRQGVVYQGTCLVCSQIFGRYDGETGDSHLKHYDSKLNLFSKPRPYTYQVRWRYSSDTNKTKIYVLGAENYKVHWALTSPRQLILEWLYGYFFVQSGSMIWGARRITEYTAILDTGRASSMQIWKMLLPSTLLSQREKEMFQLSNLMSSQLTKPAVLKDR